MKRPSIRRWLLIRCGVAIACLLVIVGVAIYFTVKHSMLNALDGSILETAALLGNEVELENERIQFEWQEGLYTNAALTAGGLFQYWDEQTGITTRSPALGSGNLTKFSGTDHFPVVRDILLPNGRRARAVGLRIHPFVVPEEMERMVKVGRVIDPTSRTFILVVAGDAEPINYTLNRLRWILAGSLFLSLTVGFLIIVRVVNLALKPIAHLTKQVKNRSELQVDKSLDLPPGLPSELLGLTENFNLLLGRVAGIREREAGFIRLVAHELRTPVAGLMATSEFALSRKREAIDYEKELKNCHQSALELDELVKRLFALAKLGAKSEPHSFEKIDLIALLDECLRPFIKEFADRDFSLVADLAHESLIILADPYLVRLIFINLLDNALSYTRPEGEISIVCEKSKDIIIVRFSNTTVSPPDQPERWFEPLFRKNASRHDAAQHLGIGLTLSQHAAEAMGWTLLARQTAEEQVTFEIKIPVK